MRDLAGVVTNASAAVERRRAEENRPALSTSFERPPEADVVATISAVSDGFLECEVLLSAIIEKRAHRRIAVGPIKDHATGDLNTRLQCNCISGVPARSCECADRFAFRSDEPYIQRIAGNPVGR